MSQLSLSGSSEARPAAQQPRPPIGSKFWIVKKTCFLDRLDLFFRSDAKIGHSLAQHKGTIELAQLSIQRPGSTSKPAAEEKENHTIELVFIFYLTYMLIGYPYVLSRKHTYVFSLCTLFFGQPVRPPSLAHVGCR